MPLVDRVRSIRLPNGKNGSFTNTKRVTRQVDGLLYSQRSKPQRSKQLPGTEVYNSSILGLRLDDCPSQAPKCVKKRRFNSRRPSATVLNCRLPASLVLPAFDYSPTIASTQGLVTCTAILRNGSPPPDIGGRQFPPACIPSSR